jgi:hypothetical protein
MAEESPQLYTIELERGVWYCGGALPPRTTCYAYASKHTHHGALCCLAMARRYRPFVNAKIAPVDDRTTG